PERISAWNRQAGFQRESLGQDAFRELRTAHRERYLALHDSLSSAEQVTAEQVHDMANYWWAAGGNYDELDPEIWRYWTGRLREEFPDHPTVLFVGENETRREYRDDPDARLEAVEALWRRLENVPPSSDRTFAMQGFINNTLNVVDEGEDPAWFGRWIERFRHYDRPTPEGIAYRVEGVLDRDDLRDRGIRELQRERARIETDLDALRSLSITRERQRALNDEWAARLLLVMGKGYLAGGDTLVAVDSLELASGLAWSPEVDRLLGEVNLALGDTLAAVRRFAAVAADPGTSESFADSALALVGTGVALEAWQRATDEARARMSRQVLAQADPQPIQGPVRLRDETGAESTLADLADGKPLAVVMFSRHCPWAVQALPEIERLSDLVGARGGRLVVVSEDEPDDELREVLSDNDVDLVPLFDSRREATRAFSNFGTPYHYIIDGDGTLMFKGEGSLGLSRIPLEVEALLQTKEPEGGGGP
ncbi:MAG: TlpA disulfide reductase family protein, partial [Gemmatimonadota bacterium]|nr:TlpA disulfide reductase family protein [Gemmatimonadota bacterium]